MLGFDERLQPGFRIRFPTLRMRAALPTVIHAVALTSRQRAWGMARVAAALV